MVQAMKHQTQPTGDSCVVTCCAMLTGRPVGELLEEFQDQLWARKVVTEEILQRLDVQYRRVFYEGGTVFKGFVYLIVVPSLNSRAEFHQIILDCRPDNPVVYDPARGYPGRLYYAWHPEKGEDPLAVPLVSWLNEFEVVPHV